MSPRLCSQLLYSARFFLFESRVFVDVSPAPVFLNPQEANRQPVDIFRNSEYVMRVIQFTRSDRMTEYLEKKFSLFKHYKIPPDAPYAYERLSRALTNVILVKKSPFDNVVISVQDNNRDFAASLANEIALACNVLAREYFTEIISAKMVYYDELHRNLMDDFEKKIQFLDSTLEKVALVRHQANDADTKARLASMENSMIVSTSEMSGIIDQVYDLRRTQSWVRSMMNNEDFKFVSVTQKALADQSNPVMKRILIGLAAMAAFWLVCVLLVYYNLTYKRYFQLFFSRGVT